MTPSEASLKALAARQPDEISAWLARGFLDTIRKAGGDPFAPHSFIHLSAHPAEGIEDLYEAAQLPVQRAIRTGITMLGSFCRYNCPESALLDDEQRLELLTNFLRLSSNLICSPAASSIARIACDDAKYWDKRLFQETIFPACLMCLQDLGLRFHESGFARAEIELRKDIKAALYRVIWPKFDSRHAPRTLAALIYVAPEDVITHLALLGKHVTEMHRQDSRQAELSYLTAERIVQQAVVELQAGFAELQIADADARDTWLLQALFGPKGPLLFRRESPTSIEVAPWEDLAKQMTLTNEGLATAPLGEDTLSPDGKPKQPRFVWEYKPNWLYETGSFPIQYH